MKNRMWWLNIVLQASHKICRKRSLFFNTSNHILNKIMTQQRKSNSLLETKLMAPTSFNIHQAQFTWKSGWEPSTPSCSDWATKSCKWTSRITQRYFWILRIDLLHMLIRKERDRLCHSIKHLTATMLKWRRDWSIPKIFSHICLTTINSRQTHQAVEVQLKLEEQIQLAEVSEAKQLQACHQTRAEEASPSLV